MKKPRVGPAMSPAQFKAIRKRLGLSQEGIARKIDRSFVMVNRMEQGHTPVDVETAAKLRMLGKKRKAAVGPAMSPAQFKAIRKRLGLSQEGIARKIDRSFVTVNRMEQGHTPVDVETAAKLRMLGKKRKAAA